MNAFFVDALQQYGYPVLWLVVFVAAAGAPISGSLLLFAAGAFATVGDFNIAILFPVALSAAVMGDNLGYFIGRRVGTSLIGWLERQKRFRFITPQALERGRAYFRRKAGWTVFITRSWEEVAGIFGAFSTLVLALLVVMFLFTMLVRKIHQRRRARHASTIKAVENEMLQSLGVKAEQDTGPLLTPD